MKQMRGLKDIFHRYPFYEHVLAKCKPILQELYGYRRIVPNMIEHKEVFTRSLGISSDIVRKEMYQFEDLSNN